MPEENQSPKRGRPRTRRSRAPKTPIVSVDISVAPTGAQAVASGPTRAEINAVSAEARPEVDARLAEELRHLEAECRRLEAELAKGRPSDLELRRLQRRADELAGQEEVLAQERVRLAEREAALEEREARLSVDLEMR